MTYGMQDQSAQVKLQMGQILSQQFINNQNKSTIRQVVLRNVSANNWNNPIFQDQVNFTFNYCSLIARQKSTPIAEVFNGYYASIVEIITSVMLDGCPELHRTLDQASYQTMKGHVKIFHEASAAINQAFGLQPQNAPFQAGSVASPALLGALPHANQGLGHTTAMPDMVTEGSQYVVPAHQRVEVQTAVHTIQPAGQGYYPMNAQDPTTSVTAPIEHVRDESNMLPDESILESEIVLVPFAMAAPLYDPYRLRCIKYRTQRSLYGTAFALVQDYSMNYQEHQVQHLIRNVLPLPSLENNDVGGKFIDMLTTVDAKLPNMSSVEILELINQRATEMPYDVLRQLDNGDAIFQSEYYQTYLDEKWPWSTYIDHLRRSLEFENYAVVLAADGKLGTPVAIQDSIVTAFHMIGDPVILHDRAGQQALKLGKCTSLSEFRDALLLLNEFIGEEYWNILHNRALTAIDRVLKEMWCVRISGEKPIIDSILLDMEELNSFLMSNSSMMVSATPAELELWGKAVVESIMKYMSKIFVPYTGIENLLALTNNDHAEDVANICGEDAIAYDTAFVFVQHRKVALIPLSSLYFTWAAAEEYAEVTEETFPEFYALLKRIDDSYPLHPTDDFVIMFNDGQRLSVMRNRLYKGYILRSIGL